MMKKGQTAMEYLMTYGWAILIVIVVVAALYSMGVFTVSPGVPCSPCFSYFAFVDYADGVLMIRSGPRNIVFNATDITYTSGTPAVSDGPDLDSYPECWYNSTGTESDVCSAGDDITLTGISTTGDVEITIQYRDVDSGLWHSDSATIHN